MCDIFPEVYTCCFIISMRLGMLLMSVLAIMTGVLCLTVVLQNSDISYKKVQILGSIRNPNDILKRVNMLVKSGISSMSCVFMFTGLILLFGTVFDNDGLIQIFIWVTFFNVLFGYFLVVAVALECMLMNTCVLSELDWLSGAAFLLVLVAYLSLWIYFISIANSYVMSVAA